MKQLQDRISFGFILTLLLPGLGHVYWGEYLFGVFVFLVLLVAAVLFFFSFLISLPFVVKLVLFGLPTLFYLFVFVDLWKTTRRRRDRPIHKTATAVGFLALGLLVHLLAPLSPTNFLWRNAPGLVTIANHSLEPLVAKGDICWVNRLAYRAELFFLDEPVIHSTPERWQLVRYCDDE